MRRVIMAAVAAAALAAMAAAAAVMMDDAHAQQQGSASVVSVLDGDAWSDFEDGMTISSDSPEFRGQTVGLESVQVSVDGNQVGRNGLDDNGGFARIAGPLGEGSYVLTVRDCGAMHVQVYGIGQCTLLGASMDGFPVLFEATFHIGKQSAVGGVPVRPPPPPPPVPQVSEKPPDVPADNVVEALYARIAALEAQMAELQAQMAEILERMNSVNPPGITPRPEPPAVEVPEQVPGQYYIRLLNSTDSTYGIGDRIYFEGVMPPQIPTYGLDNQTVINDGGSSMLSVKSAGHQHYVMTIHSQGSSTTMKEFVANGESLARVTSANVTANLVTLEGYVEVIGRLTPGEHYLNLHTYRNPHPYTDSAYTDYYSDKFTLQ